MFLWIIAYGSAVVNREFYIPSLLRHPFSAIIRSYGGTEHEQRLYRHTGKGAVAAPGAGARGGGAFGRGEHHPLHRPVSQGGHRFAGRPGASDAFGAPGIPARPGQAAGGDRQGPDRAGRADGSIDGADRKGGDAGGTGGHLPPIPAQAAHAGDGREGARTGAAGKLAAGTAREGRSL